jgi:hypothetical protein
MSSFLLGALLASALLYYALLDRQGGYTVIICVMMVDGISVF